MFVCYGIFKGLNDEMVINQSRSLPTASLIASQGGLSLRQAKTRLAPAGTPTAGRGIR
ncbi:hypothetical protein GCM10027287_29010 [Bordetella muralis]